LLGGLLARRWDPAAGAARGQPSTRQGLRSWRRQSDGSLGCRAGGHHDQV